MPCYFFLSFSRALRLCLTPKSQGGREPWFFLCVCILLVVIIVLQLMVNKPFFSTQSCFTRLHTVHSSYKHQIGLVFSTSCGFRGKNRATSISTIFRAYYFPKPQFFVFANNFWILLAQNDFTVLTRRKTLLNRLVLSKYVCFVWLM